MGGEEEGERDWKGKEGEGNRIEGKGREWKGRGGRKRGGEGMDAPGTGPPKILVYCLFSLSLSYLSLFEVMTGSMTHIAASVIV
jgi:hypothetical protein